MKSELILCIRAPATGWEKLGETMPSKCTSHHLACPCREEQFARALDIADETMTSLIQCHALRADEHGVSWALIDADGEAVNTLDAAEPPLIEAVEWLQERGLCQLVESESGGMVVVLLSDIEESTV